MGSITFTGMLFRNHRVKFSVGEKKEVEELLIKQRTDGGVRC